MSNDNPLPPFEEQPTPVPSPTPNVVIEDPATRRKLTSWLGGVSLGVGVVALFFAFFPEAAFGSDIPDRGVQFINSLVLLISGWYGLSVTRPNTPKF